MYIRLFYMGIVLNFARSFPQSIQKQYNPNVHQYDLSLLQPQFQVPNYNFVPQEKQYAGVPPQILYYGAAGGQPFLIQPGGLHPGTNFLVPQPQPGPNVILRDSPPPRPVFVGGYPKPAYIPPIEKDAEEVPTNPSQIPPFVHKDRDERKPEKLETFNEDEPVFPKKSTPQQPVDRPLGPALGLQPGQRFFILNGQPLFTSYPFNNLYNPNVHQHGLKYTSEFKSPEFRSAPQEYDLLQFHDEENDAIIVDARNEELEQSTTTEKPSKPLQESGDKSGEPTISQAQPVAVALAGPGGVASAAPRGSAFVGKDGLAVSSPQATAVAGPSKEENGEKKKPLKRNP